MNRDLAQGDGGGRKPQKPSDVLDAAADLITPEGAWTQKTWARDAAGLSDPAPEDAVCFCMWGAVFAVNGHDAGSGLEERLERVVPAFIRWNDAPERTQAEVVAKLREAAELARSEGS